MNKNNFSNKNVNVFKYFWSVIIRSSGLTRGGNLRWFSDDWSCASNSQSRPPFTIYRTGDLVKRSKVPKAFYRACGFCAVHRSDIGLYYTRKVYILNPQEGNRLVDKQTILVFLAPFIFILIPSIYILLASFKNANKISSN